MTTSNKPPGKKTAFETVNRISEIIWLSISIVCAILTLVIFIRDGANAASPYIVVVLISFSYFLLRRWLRKRVERGMKKNG